MEVSQTHYFSVKAWQEESMKMSTVLLKSLINSSLIISLKTIVRSLKNVPIRDSIFVSSYILTPSMIST
jgi:hypothetical protein